MKNRWKLGMALAVSMLLIYAGMNLNRIWQPAAPTVSEAKRLALKGAVDPFKPAIDLDELGVKAESISAVGLQQDGRPIAHKVEILPERLVFTDSSAGPVFALNATFMLNLVTDDGARYAISFTTAGLPDITETSSRQVVMVPAMPEKGFHWPYFLAVPSKSNRQEGHRRYLTVDTTNTGPGKSLDEMLNGARTQVTGRGQISMVVADQLGLPLLYPAFPRPRVAYEHQGERNEFYTHAFDRDTARLHLTLRDPSGAQTLPDAFRKAGYDVNTFVRLDLQLNAMIDHAIEYLNQYGHKVEPKKVFLNGYSASGTFVDRYTLLNPDRVKAVAAGATVDDMALPLAEHKGKSLIFPIGTSDYEEITGRSFDLGKHNQVARLIFMGADDTVNTLPYSDTYGAREREIITALWGTDVLPRALALTRLYGESGGRGMIILDTGTKHGMSPSMQDYVKTFFQANLDSDQPVYPLPGNPEQLRFTLLK